MMPDKDYQSKRDEIIERMAGRPAVEAFQAIDPSLGLSGEVVAEGKRFLEKIKQQARKQFDAIVSEERQKAADERESKLLDELEKSAMHYTDVTLEADALDPWAVPVSVIASKRQQPSKDKGGTR